MDEKTLNFIKKAKEIHGDKYDYFTEVFKSLDDLFKEIDKIINQDKITITSSDIRGIVNEVIIKILKYDN